MKAGVCCAAGQWRAGRKTRLFVSWRRLNRRHARTAPLRGNKRAALIIEQRKTTPATLLHNARRGMAHHLAYSGAWRII